VGGGLVGDDVRRHAAAHEFGIDVRGIGDERDGQRRLGRARGLDHLQRADEIRSDVLEITDLLPSAGPLRIYFDAEDRRAGHAAREWL